jgi:hypothetical protein
MDSPSVATRAGALTRSLKEEVSSHDESDYFVI